MLKQLQEPAPSVLEERPDLHPAVGQILSRAMAKRPEDRYQCVGDLVEDLLIAAGAEVGATPPAPPSASDRIVAPAQSEAALPVAGADEETLVRPRVDAGLGAYQAPRTTEIYPASPSSSLNPWKILIPALAGLLVVFAVVYVFTRNSQPVNSNQSQPALVADPNSQAVEPSPPATGSGEAGIPSGGATTNQAADSNTNANANINANAEETFTPTENLNANANANIEGNQNSNANSNRPSADVPLPAPSRQVNSNQQVLPPGTPTPETKPTVPPPTVSPPASPEEPS
jgi:serine/threonine-protein kinase